MAKFSQERKELIEKFERNFKDVFLKTSDLATYYTGIYIEPEFGEFEYHEGKDNELHITTAAEHTKGKLIIRPKVTIPSNEYADNILRDYTYAIYAAHEAGELLYVVARDYVGKNYYKIEGEIVGEFFFRLFREKYDVNINPKVSAKFFGRYDVASRVIDNLEKLPFKEQITEIRMRIFGKDKTRLKIADKLARFLDRLDKPR